MNREPYLKRIILYGRGGLIGIFLFMLLWVVIFFIAFMTSFRNYTTEAWVTTPMSPHQLFMKRGIRNDRLQKVQIPKKFNEDAEHMKTG